MPQEIIDYLATQRVGVLAVEMPDGSPHGATLHFATNTEANEFYFRTSPAYKKMESLAERTTTRASFVVGTTEAEMKTFQLDGVLRKITAEEQAAFEAAYLGKLTEKKGKSSDGVGLVFTPTWWRFTDWTKPEGKFVLSSETTSN